MPRRPIPRQGALVLSIACLLAGAPGAARAQGTFEHIHTFDSPPREPLGPLVMGDDGALYGTTSSGGAFGAGVVFKVRPDGSGYEKLHDFDTADGANPAAGLVKGPDGALYGTTRSGGMSWGVVFRIQEDGTGFTELHEFEFSAHGGMPEAPLALASDGFLYGTARSGGASGWGVVFRVGTAPGTFAKIHDFDYTTGGYPLGALIEGTDGCLYGTTFQGGTHAQGVVFKIAKDGTGYTRLHDFDAVEGANPRGALVRGASGLYGATSRGGPLGYGSLFRLNEDGSAFQFVHQFDGTDGSDPVGGLVIGSDFALYGTTQQGGSGWGSSFRLTEGGAFQKLADFDGTNGQSPQPLLRGSDGNLYGTALFGGSLGHGVVFRLTESGALGKLLDLGSSDGSQPYAGLIRGDDGALYGTASVGGRSNQGVVFKVREDGTGFEKLHEFAGPDGANPHAPLAIGTMGSLFGTTRSGGASGRGVVFRVNQDGSGFSVLHHFAGGDGGEPHGGLVRHSNGSLLGLTSSGGSGSGVVYRISEGGDFETLHEFSGPDGASPAYGALAEGPDGALYGTTAGGGATSQGVVFKINPDGSGFATLHDFDYAGGAYPSGGLTAGHDGALYGTTSQGGAYGQGTVFRITPDGASFGVLRSFDFYSSGGYPQAGLSRGSDGKLLGTTYGGGSGGYGTVFRISEDGTYFARLHSFDFTGGGLPYGQVLEGADGALYGTTSFGGPAFGGVVFRLVPEADGDDDGALDSSDNCRTVPNPDQRDNDFDGQGDACDDDDDNDGQLDATDNCPVSYNPDQLNRYGGPAGDACEDTDADSFLDASDNCPLVANPMQSDGDSDGVGDACDLPNLWISDVTINEEDWGLVNAGFVVGMYPPSSTPVTVDVRTTPGAATSGSDFVPLALTMTFKPGQTAKSLTVKLKGDKEDEGDESYFVDLSNAVGAEIRDGQGFGTILDDDEAPRVSVDSPSAVEGYRDRTLLFTLRLSEASGKPISVAYATADGSATAPDDYLPASGEVTFDPGECARTIPVTIRGDRLKEPNERFFLDLVSATNATIAVARGAATIRDDDR